jgi:hypothetical protein
MITQVWAMLLVVWMVTGRLVAKSSPLFKPELCNYGQGMLDLLNQLKSDGNLLYFVSFSVLILFVGKPAQGV